MSDVEAHNRARFDALVNHPYFGSLWLIDCEERDGYVVGYAWDDSGVGSPYLPDDWRGEGVLMNFPASCVRKRVLR